MIYNIDVSNLLCNRAMETLIGVEVSKDGNVDKFVVKFDMTKAGQKISLTMPINIQEALNLSSLTLKDNTLAKNANTITR